MDLRRLTPADADAYRSFMLRAYADDPAAFTSTVAEREPLPLDWWRERVSDRPEAEAAVIGAFEHDQLVGVAGLRFQHRPRTRHKGLLFGMAVAPAVRGRSVGRALVEAVVDRARDAGLRVVQLTVMETNAPARQLYEACGFAAFGTEPLAIRMDDGFVGLVHMSREIEPAADAG